MEKLVAVRVERTSDYPSRWEVSLDSGGIAKVQFYYGQISVMVGMGTVFVEQVGSQGEAYMTNGEMIKHTARVIDWTEVK